MKQILIICLSLFSFCTSNAFTLNSSTNPDLKGWSDSNVQLYVNTANCPAGIDVPSIISGAVAVWNNVPTSSIKVSYDGTTTSTTMSGPTTVYCETNFQSVVGADQNSVPGAAAVNGTSGRITQGILYLNASVGQANIGNFDQTLLKVILAHEIGHILGLGHSQSTKALMYYDASAKNTLSLSQDDIDGMSYLYPSDEISDKKFAGCGLVKSLPPPTSGKMNLIFLIMLLPFTIYLGLRNLKLT
ncbi:MAG: matrixin family metalloprotease [Pseudobdellovibrio sp.]